MTETARSVGFVGLGAMGMPMALNLLRAGHRVRAFDVSPAARTGFAERRARPATARRRPRQGRRSWC
jgi:3-hydroxyisobutyrate dehydrogenase